MKGCAARTLHYTGYSSNPSVNPARGRGRGRVGCFGTGIGPCPSPPLSLGPSKAKGRGGYNKQAAGKKHTPSPSLLPSLPSCLPACSPFPSPPPVHLPPTQPLPPSPSQTITTTTLCVCCKLVVAVVPSCTALHSWLSVRESIPSPLHTIPVGEHLPPLQLQLRVFGAEDFGVLWRGHRMSE